MRLKILLPYQIFADVEEVLRLVVHTPDGALASCRIDSIA